MEGYSGDQQLLLSIQPILMDYSLQLQHEVVQNSKENSFRKLLLHFVALIANRTGAQNDNKGRRGSVVAIGASAESGGGVDPAVKSAASRGECGHA
jgi:hypothetical protein